jgi:SAM-dependent methyltransferase
MASAAAGIILERNNNRNAEVIGVDQAKFLKKYAGHLKNEKLQVANISARDAKLDELPNEWTGKFDLVISNFSLSRCISNSSSPVTESRAKLLSEMIKCLRPGGRLAIFDANQTCIHYEYLLKRNDQVSDVLKTPEVPVGHKSHIVFATRSK